MKKLMEDRPVWDYKALADAQAQLYEKPHLLVREAADILGIDPLEHFQEEIIEFARLFPKVIRPEKTYGDRWYEFLKKKGIDPEIFRAKKKPKTVKSTSPDLEKAKLEVLSILNGLEFAGYSEEARAKAMEKLSAKITELSRGRLTPKNLQALGLYAYAIEMIKAKNFERLKEVENL